MVLVVGSMPAIATEVVQHSFSSQFFSPQYPIGHLAVSGSTLYGVSLAGLNGNGNGSIFSMTTSGNVTNLYSFQGGSSDGAIPHSGPLLVNGVLYGAADYGGSAGMGAIYAYSLSTHQERILHSFTGTNVGTPANSDGQFSDSTPLYNPADGYLYGVSEAGDAPGFTNGLGTVWKIKTDGTGYQVIHEFSFDSTVSNPQHGLALTPDGYLWGTAIYSNGELGAGGVYKLKTDGSNFQFLLSFSSAAPNPYFPASDIVRASDGNLYFTCGYGGAYGLGTVEKIVPGTNAISTVWSFDGYTGANPVNNVQNYLENRLYQSPADHNLYGVTAGGGAYGLGTAFEFNISTGACTRLCSFNIGDANATANPPVALGSNFYLTSTSGGLTASEFSAGGYGAGLSVSPKGTIKVIQNFYVQDLSVGTGVTSSGGGLIQDGSLYVGIAPSGGAFGDGGVYSITSSGAYNVIHHFNNNPPAQAGTGYEGYNGNTPPLLNPNDHLIYGACSQGGAGGAGTIWKMTIAGAYTKLHDVDSINEGDAMPSSLAVGSGSDKNLYGAFLYNGDFSGSAGGTLWKMSATGKAFTVLHLFPALDNQPYNPSSSLVEDSTGTLWGVCFQGGAFGYGCIFKVGNTGANFADVLDFNLANGANPNADRLILVGAVLYGEAEGGGANGDGVLWSYNTSTNAYSILHSFASGGDGAGPMGGVIYNSSSNTLYGTCYTGGSVKSCGTVWSFDLTTAALTVLHQFAGFNSSNPGASDGADPEEGVILGTDGLLHGVTVFGGEYNQGAIFTQTITP